MAKYGTWFKARLEEAKKRRAFRVQQLTVSFANKLAQIMKAKEINNSELAERIGSSPAYMTKVLRGDANYTIETMVKLADASGSTLRISLEPKIAGEWQKLKHVKNTPTGVKVGLVANSSYFPFDKAVA